jgi:hypothetical protein
MSDRAFLQARNLKPAPGIRSLPRSLLLPFARFRHRRSPGSVSKTIEASTCRCAGGLPSLPQGSLAPVRVVLSRSINAYYSPMRQSHRHAATSRLCAYTQRLRCAGAPRRPASGSGLSLTIPAWHAALYDPGEFDHRYGPVLRCRHGLRRDLSGSALPNLPQSVSRGARISGLPDSRICYGLPSCSPPCTDQTDMLGLRGLLLPGFQRIGRPPRCRIYLQQRLDSSVGGTLTRWNGS